LINDTSTVLMLTSQQRTIFYVTIICSFLHYITLHQLLLETITTNLTVKYNGPNWFSPNMVIETNNYLIAT